MKPSSWLTLTGNAGIYVLAGIQTNEVFQIVELVLAILTSIVLLAYRLWCWYKEAKKDGKITTEEIKEAGEIIQNSLEDTTSKIKKGEEKK